MSDSALLSPISVVLTYQAQTDIADHGYRIEHPPMTESFNCYITGKGGYIVLTGEKRGVSLPN
jgi:hypothetical protein